MRILLSIFMLLTLISCASTNNQVSKTISGVDHNDKKIEVNTALKKGTVVVFLSSFCPCSRSHTALLKKMNKENKNFQFVGIHSNYNEDKNKAKEYFKKEDLGFPVIYDKDSKIARKLGGVKTPHVFLIKEGKVLYTGSVTNTNNAKQAKENYLLQALNEVGAGKPVSVSKRKTLGCYIPLRD